MEQDIKDFVFMEHFNPLRDTSLTPIKDCPFCHSKIYSIVEGKRICYRCGKIYKEQDGN
jgi:hypothetical protein